MKACRREDSTSKEIIKLLLKNGADVSRRDFEGKTALFYGSVIEYFLFKPFIFFFMIFSCDFW